MVAGKSVAVAPARKAVAAMEGRVLHNASEVPATERDDTGCTMAGLDAMKLTAAAFECQAKVVDRCCVDGDHHRPAVSAPGLVSRS